MQKIALFMVLTMACTLARGQTPNRTPAQIRKDSLDLLEYKRLYPEWYRFSQAPYIMSDSSVLIKGYGNVLHLQNNYVVDSIHNNFHADMPDTTTVTPYSSISVGGERVTISYLSGFMGIGMGNGGGAIVPTTPEDMRKDSLALVAGDTTIKGMVIYYQEPKDPDTFYIRLTLNGRLLSDWKNLKSFPATFCKGTSTFVLRGKHSPPMTTRSWGYTYLICDTPLRLHDQLLIEIKDSKKNWMLGRYNFTRVAAAPQASAIRITGEEGRPALVSSLEKKTSDSDPAPRISR